MRALLDVNVLIALLDPDHAHHGRVREWFRVEAPRGWASCPITQNGCVRIMSQPAYPNRLAPAAIVDRLGHATRHPLHERWADDVSLLDPELVDASRIHGPKQITDVYLIALAAAHGGRFATMDARATSAAVRAASADTVVVV